MIVVPRGAPAVEVDFDGKVIRAVLRTEYMVTLNAVYCACLACGEGLPLEYLKECNAPFHPRQWYWKLRDGWTITDEAWNRLRQGFVLTDKFIYDLGE